MKYPDKYNFGNVIAIPHVCLAKENEKQSIKIKKLLSK